VLLILAQQQTELQQQVHVLAMEHLIILANVIQLQIYNNNQNTGGALKC